MSKQTKHEDCCLAFDSSVWDQKEHFWQDKLFIKDSIPQFMHMPLPGTYRRSIERMWNAAVNAGAAPDMKDFLLLAYDPSPWKSDLYMSVTKEVDKAENLRLSGTFITKVYDGPYHKIPDYIKDFNSYLSSTNRTAVKLYFYFPFCPACAKKYGHNYIVAFAEV